MIRFIKWLWWNMHYVCRGSPSTFEGYIIYLTRRRWPWKKFKPLASHCDVAERWHVYLKDEPSVTVGRHMLVVYLRVGEDSGEVVGFDVYDSQLEFAGWQKGTLTPPAESE